MIDVVAVVRCVLGRRCRLPVVNGVLPFWEAERERERSMELITKEMKWGGIKRIV